MEIRIEWLEMSEKQLKDIFEYYYKIIYWQRENLVTIFSVFDCRQNLAKINRI